MKYMLILILSVSYLYGLQAFNQAAQLHISQLHQLYTTDEASLLAISPQK